MDHAHLATLYREHVADLERRYGAALVEAGYDAVVIHSGSLKKRTDFDDQFWPLRPTPHFHHWLPLSEADCALIVRPGRRPTLLRLKITSFWEKPAKIEHDYFLESFEVLEIEKPEDMKQHLPSTKFFYIGEDRARAASWDIAADAINPEALVARLDALRVRKTRYEIACIEEANRRAAAGHDAVQARFRAGDCSELELHLAFLAATNQDDPETPYKNIVALNANGATLHHISYLKEVERRPAQSLLLDAGATFQGYCSDITRTWVKGSGAAASAFAQLIDGVEKMQQRLCDGVQVGLPYEQLHEEAHRQVGAILRDVGLVSLSDEVIGKDGVSRAFFPHGLGHSLGLQCHDVGCALVKPKVENPYLRNTSTITEGQVFTIEPGIYFIDPLLAPLRAGPHAGAIDWRLVDELALMGGVRIEDDLVVTGGEDVTRNLTRELLPVGGGSI
jgi:Xaa-Pro dipeptidase